MRISDWSSDVCSSDLLFTPVDFDAYTINGGGADIDGVEISLNLRPTRNLSFSSNIAYNDARLSTLLPDSFAPGGGYAKGTRLPGASEWTLSHSLDLSFADAPRKPRFGFAYRYLRSEERRVGKGWGSTCRD